VAYDTTTVVVVIDDDPSFARILLEDEGACVVRIASTPAEALKILELNKVVQLVIGDAATLLGQHETSHVSALRSLSKTEIVLLTTDPDLVTESDCRRLGVTRILPKPFDPQDALNLLEPHKT